MKSYADIIVRPLITEKSMDGVCDIKIVTAYLDNII